MAVERIVLLLCYWNDNIMRIVNNPLVDETPVPSFIPAVNTMVAIDTINVVQTIPVANTMLLHKEGAKKMLQLSII
jgi:hypothetical protein